MSWERQVKILCTISISLLFYIFWLILGNMFIVLFKAKTALKFDLYLIWLVLLFFMQFMKSRTKKPVLVISSTLLLAVPPLLLKCYVKQQLINSAFVMNYVVFTAVLMLFYVFSLEDMQYELYKKRVNDSYLLLLGLVTVLPVLKGSIALEILRFYALYLATTVVCLREGSLNYFQIKKKKTYLGNILVFTIVLFTASDRVLSFVMGMLGIIYRVYDFIASHIIVLILTVIGTPIVMLLQAIISYLLNLFHKKQDGLTPINLDAQGAMKKMQNELLAVKPESHLPLFIKIGLLLVLLYIIYLVVKRIRKQPALETVQAEDERERIVRKKKENKTIGGLQQLFKREGIRESILSIYRRFEIRTDKKEIYKNTMTAEELEAAAKRLVAQKEALQAVTDIYNEAKFSDHDLEEGKLTEIKENYGQIRKEL